jgi:hypothetical protein
MKTYSVLLSVLGVLMIALNLGVFLFFQHSAGAFRVYTLIEFLFGAFGLLAFGLFLMLFSTFIYSKLVR